MRSWRTDVTSGLRDLLTSGEETDFTLTCTDGDVKCHRVMLLAAGGGLSGRVRDRLSDNVSRLDVSKLGIGREVGREVLMGLYGGVTEGLLRQENIPQFVHFAVHFELKWLMTEIIEVFGTVLSSCNVLELLKYNEIACSTHLSRIVENYCSESFEEIVDKADFEVASLDGILMIGRVAGSRDNFDCDKLFKKMMSWILSRDENLKSASTVLSLIPLTMIPKGKLQTEVYDLIFNQLIIGKGDLIPQQDKVILSSLYQEAVRKHDFLSSNQERRLNDNGKKEPNGIKVEAVKSVDKELTLSGETKSKESESSNKKTKELGSSNKKTEQLDEAKARHPSPITSSTKPRKITSYISSREWSNMEVDEIQKFLNQDNLVDTEFLIVESILVWIAADPYRRQHCEQLLRSCRFSSLCPVYIRAVLTTFITEKMVGSGRLTNNILRSPSSPRPGSAVGRLAGVCDDVPLSVQRLQFGEHVLGVKCSCGGRGEARLYVSGELPTATVREFRCRDCGRTPILHTACSSTLTPDIFPSMHLLAFNLLARLISSMDDLRIYIFK